MFADDHRFRAGEGDRAEVRLLPFGDVTGGPFPSLPLEWFGQRFLRPRLVVAQQRPALPYGIPDRWIVRVEGDAVEIALEAFRRRGRVLLPQPRFRAPHPHRAEVADGERAVGLRPGDRAQRRRADRAAGAEQELALPALPGDVACDGAIGADGKRLCVRVARSVPGCGATAVNGARADTGQLVRRWGTRPAGDLHRPFQPAVARACRRRRRARRQDPRRASAGRSCLPG